ncbi:MAG TPA: hypothetical protein VI524_04425 [Anaerolineales bacterium]|nr:hypothetical protein [Anaerolineales bacterium]
MNIQTLIRRIRNSLRLQRQLPNEAVLGFLRVLENVREEDISCTEIYSKLDEYVERQVSRKDAAQLMPLIREHLDVCEECCEEYEALLNVINGNAQA